MTSSIATLMRDRDYHLKKAKGNKSGQHWRVYRELRNRVHRSIKKAKSEYYTNLIEDCKGNATEFWSALKETLPSSRASSGITSLSTDGVVMTSAHSIASALNSFFVSVGKKLAERISPLSTVYDVTSTATSCVFSFQSISEEFVVNSIKQLKPNKAIGLDKISARLLKDSVEVIAPVLTSLFNMSLETSAFPSIWKSARVVPLFKKGSKQDPSNYRPISILPTLSKILEKAVHSQFYSYLSENNLLSLNQFGFRFKSSTVTAAAKFTDQILHGMDDGLITGVAFLDLTKAFDTVNHSILLRKISNIGVDGTARDWFDSFLSNRSQVTCCNNKQSDPASISIGVAQGSILGPLLFIIYMNDLSDVLEFCNVSLYADDTVLYFASKSISEIESKINSDLSRVCCWMRANQLTLNVTKSKFMLIGSNARLNKVNSITISSDGNLLEEVQSFLYLGLVINKNLTWEDHIEHIRRKINKKLGLLRRIKSCLPLSARITFFNSFVLPLFDYGDVIWGDRSNATLMSELQVLHNKAARLILDLPPSASASDALAKLHWKLLQRRRAEHRAIFMYKSINNYFCHSFQFSFNREFHDHNTRSRNNIRKSAANRRWGHWSSINFAADVWNSLDISLRDSSSLFIFKRNIKKAIF